MHKKFTLPLMAMQENERYNLRIQSIATFASDIPPVLQKPKPKQSEYRPMIQHNMFKSSWTPKSKPKRPLSVSVSDSHVK